MNIVKEPLPGGSALARDYIENFEKVSHLYGGDFRSKESRSIRAEWLDRSEGLRADRTQVAACLRQYNEKHNSHDAVMSSWHF